jgi:hypothetical protein
LLPSNSNREQRRAHQVLPATFCRLKSALWHKQAIIYTIDPETFSDGDGDGIVDFPALTGKLDYLAGLNVNW